VHSITTRFPNAFLNILAYLVHYKSIVNRYNHKQRYYFQDSCNPLLIVLINNWDNKYYFFALSIIYTVKELSLGGNYTSLLWIRPIQRSNPNQDQRLAYVLAIRTYRTSQGQWLTSAKHGWNNDWQIENRKTEKILS